MVRERTRKVHAALCDAHAFIEGLDQSDTGSRKLGLPSVMRRTCQLPRMQRTMLMTIQ